MCNEFSLHSAPMTVLGSSSFFKADYPLFLLVLVFFWELQDLTIKCNEEEKSLSTETFSKVSLTNLRRPAVPDLSTDLGMNIFKKVCERKLHFNLAMIQHLSVFLSSCWRSAQTKYSWGLLGIHIHAICEFIIPFHWDWFCVLLHWFLYAHPKHDAEVFIQVIVVMHERRALKLCWILSASARCSSR